MGKISTQNKIEAQQTGKIYINPKYLSGLRRMEIYRCKYCGNVLGDSVKMNSFCDVFCRELGSSEHLELHKCIKCGLEKPNKAVGNDNFQMIVQVSANPKSE